MYIDTPSDQKLRKTTIGWELCCQWKYGETYGVNLKDMTESYLTKVSECAIDNKILEEPAFSWWAKIALKYCNRMINDVKYRYWSRTYIFGHEIPHSWAEAIFIDRKTGIDYWRRAIKKEMETAGIAFKIFNDRLVGHTEIN